MKGYKESTNLSNDSVEIEDLKKMGMVEITSVGEENVYFTKNYFVKLGSITKYNLEGKIVKAKDIPRLAGSKSKSSPKGYKEKISTLKERAKNSLKEKTNESVIDMFIEDSFPKDKRQTWGTPNLKITKTDSGWGLKNYDTFLLRRENGNLYFNDKKYSKSTTRIQNLIKKKLEDKGIDYKIN